MKQPRIDVRAVGLGSSLIPAYAENRWAPNSRHGPENLYSLTPVASSGLGSVK